MISLDEIKQIRLKRNCLDLLQSCFKDDPAKFVVEISSSLNSLLFTNLRTAAKYLKYCEQVFKYLPEQYQSNLLAMQGRLFHWSGQPRQALKKYSQACKSFVKYGNKKGEMRTNVGLMDVHMYLGNYTQALKIGRSSLKYFKRHNLRILAANTMINIGNVYHRLDKNYLALRHYNNAKSIYAKKDQVRLAMAEFNKANIYANLYQLDKASELYKKAAKIYAKLDMDINRCKAEYSLAYINFLSDKYVSALQAFENLHDEFIKLGDIKTAAVTQLDLAELHLHLNQIGTACLIGKDLIKQFDQLGMHYEKGKAQYFVSDASIRLGDYTEASKYLSDARKSFSKEQNLLWSGMVSEAYARLSLKQNRPIRAMKQVKRALNLLTRSGDERRKLDAQITLLEIHMLGKRPHAAVKKAQSFLRRRLASYQKYNLECLLGQYFSKDNRHETALEYFNKAVKTTEKMLTGLYPDEVRHFFMQDKAQAYEAAVNSLLKMNRKKDGLMMNLYLLSVVNERHNISKEQKTKIPKELQQKIRHLRSSLRNLNRDSHAGHRSTPASKSYSQTEQQLWLHEQKVRSYNKLHNNGSAIQKARLESVLDEVKEDEILLNYVVADGSIAVFCVSDSNINFIRLEITRKELEGLIRELSFVMENTVLNDMGMTDNGAANYYLKRIHDTLVVPGECYSRNKKPTLVIDGIFSQIPWMAVFNNHLGPKSPKRSVKITSNPLDLISSRNKIGSFSKAENAVFAVSSPSLPFVQDESEHITNLYPHAKNYKDEMAKVATLKKCLKSTKGFMHIATHSSHSSENPLFSRILMSDGPFFPFDLFETGLQVELVTLSGCQTAAPGLNYGNSFSLAKSFLQAGSRFVLASLWQVSDKVSGEFMKKFYQELKNTNNIFDSYKMAVDEISSQYENPAFWSSFVLLGV